MIEYNNRLLVVGRTRSGKSEFLNTLASGLQCQWVNADPKDEFAIDGVPKVHDVGDLDFAGQRILHWVPPPDPAAWERFFARVWALRTAQPPGRLVVVVHEAGYSCNFKPNSVGVMHNTVLSQGEAMGIGCWYATQRPVCLPTFATSEPAHVIAFAEKMTRADDHQTLAAAISMEHRQLADAQAHLLAVHGRRGYIWFDREDGRLQGMPPVPDELRARNIVRRTSPE